MLRNRLVILVLLPAIIAVWYGGWLDRVLALALAIAAWEYAHIPAGGAETSAIMLMIAAGLVVTRMVLALKEAPRRLLPDHGERQGPPLRLRDWRWGSRYQPGDYDRRPGLHWLARRLCNLNPRDAFRYVVSAACLPFSLMADFGGYVIGIPFGRHKMNQDQPGKKSWEGYIGGISWLAAAYLFCFFVNPVDTE